MTDAPDLHIGPDGRPRCFWCQDGPEIMVPYHDDEWGRPVTDDRQLFEKLVLESFQSGLSWRTILAKRENFRRAFKGFDPAAVARFSKRKVAALMKDASIVRNRRKIEAAVNNARRYAELVDEFGSLSDFAWSFAPDPKSRPKRFDRRTIPAVTPESEALAAALKKRGWAFLGPTTVYAFMQAMGLVNDHVDGCAWR